jgi:hypothetical protein
MVMITYHDEVIVNLLWQNLRLFVSMGDAQFHIAHPAVGLYIELQGKDMYSCLRFSE